ncbi:MAG: hypothetical protein ACFB13_12080 [Kiloniellaceae bacterium]
MDIVAALQATSQGLAVLKQLRDIEKNFDIATLKIQIAELADALTAAKLALMEAQEALSKKDAEIASLRRTFQRSTETVEAEGYRYDKSDNGQKPTGTPYCPVCLEVEGLLIRLVQAQQAPFGDLNCPKCKAKFGNVPTFDR